ncbi:MAG: helix-hairpin-helix domain-containing protein [Bacilli bacterium]|nr:helix-hairpin-helix domain-containing protein [Bacilli bacterium]
MNKKLAIAIGIFLVLVGLFLTYYKPSKTTIEEPPLEEIPIIERIIVQISGEVKRPGLYELAEGARLCDLVILAGGLTTEADEVTLNLASLLADGIHIHVQKRADNSSTSQLISINYATKEELMTLEGIGETKAQNIVAYRTQKGLFKTLEELMNVSGITASIYAKIKNSICL